MPFQLTDDIKIRLAAKLPDGRRVEDIRIVECSAKVFTGTEELSESEQALIASVEMAGGPPLISDGVPTVMRVVAWLAHEGINKNRLAFRADDFGLAADRIREPNFLVMDWNHSAVMPWAFDQKAIGVWYRAEKRWDVKANDGKGAYGILAYGIVWSWAFPEYANTMLAEQARNGKIDFSMACLPESVEIASDENGIYEIAHRPVFLTLSALDVPPADPDAVGRGDEAPTDENPEARLRDELLAAGTPALAAAAPPDPAVPASPASAVLTEEDMDELQEQIAALTAQLEEANQRNAEREAVQAALVTATQEIETLREQLTETQTTNEALRAESEGVVAQVTALTEQLATANAQLAEIAEREAAAARVARYATRLAELPEKYVAALTARSEEERTRFEAKWTNAEDTEWEEFRKEITLAFQSFSYLRASQLEGGNLPLGGVTNEGIADLLSAIKK